MLLQPQFIDISELSTYGLPDTTQEPNIISFVQGASVLIDQYCARQNTDGVGSLIWTTYTERLLLPQGRNLLRCTYRPVVALTPSILAPYAASSHNVTAANSTYLQDGATVALLVSASGRYGYARRAQQQVYPDLNYGANILQVASYFGGPPQFTPIAVNMTDVDPLTGEVWVPSGLYLSQYTEVVLVYNSGFPPDRIPAAVKQACSLVVKNYLSRPATGLSAFSVQNLHHQFTPMLIDDTIDRLLMSYKTVLAM